MKSTYGLPLNAIMLENKRTTLPNWKMIGLCYLIYVAITLVTMVIFQSKSIATVLVADFLAAWACGLFMVTKGNRSFLSLGMSKKWKRPYIMGWGMAFMVMVAIWMGNVFLRTIDFSGNPSFRLPVFLLLLIGFIFQGFMEEFLFRGLIFTQVSLKHGVILGMIINSILFSIGHLGNSNASILSVANTFGISVVFSMMYYYHGNIWLISGFHSGWNFIMGPVLGVEVSGFLLPTTVFKTVLKHDFSSINGGGYGFEGGYAVTAAVLGMIFLYVILLKKQYSQK